MTLPAHINALLNPTAYPEPPASIELHQTHISYIFLTPEIVYKVKKTVNFGFLDFSTLEKRLFYCNEEVRLNNRLAPGMYLGVVPICADGEKFRVGGPGTPVDYAVKMARLGPDTILEEMIKKDKAGPEIIKKTAQAIANFHRAAQTDTRISAFGSIDTITKNCEENFSQSKEFDETIISPEKLKTIRDYTRNFLKTNARLFERRMGSGFIRDCHGDIHLEHVSIAGEIKIFDCIEFNERFRFSDIISDAAFLSMDLDFHNRHDLAAIFEDEYLRAMNDADGRLLLDFYKCYRAYVRGKVDGLKASETEVTGAEKTEARLGALRHFHLSCLYASGGFRPTLIIMRGLSATGKTGLAKALGEAINAPVISSDIVRKELAGLPANKRLAAGFQEGIYSKEFTDKTYAELMRRAASLIKDGRSCIIDATFSKSTFIKKAGDAASSAKALFKIIECAADDTAIKERIEKRLGMKPAPGEPVPDITWETYQGQKKAFEKSDAPALICDSKKSLDENRLTAIEWVFS